MATLICQTDYQTPIACDMYNPCNHNGVPTFGTRKDRAYPDANKNSMPNCPAYANGRYSYLAYGQTFDHFKLYQGHYYQETNDALSGFGTRGASGWWGNAPNSLKSQTPSLGAVICWSYGSSGSGHVAIVEAVSDDGHYILISESGWSLSRNHKPFEQWVNCEVLTDLYTGKFDRVDTAVNNPWNFITAHPWIMPSYGFQGFIRNPNNFSSYNLTGTPVSFLGFDGDGKKINSDMGGNVVQKEIARKFYIRRRWKHSADIFI